MLNVKAAIVITALIGIGLGLLGGYFWGKNAASKNGAAVPNGGNGTTPAK